MNHHEKLEALYRHAESLGIDRATAAPPAWRLMWRFGWQVPPPLFLGFWPLAFGSGIAFGVLWGLAMLFVAQFRPVFITWRAATLAGVCFGLLFAAVLRLKASRYNLPSWSEYTGTPPRA
ncbi:DUF6404 family protein [Lysobacter sp. N42]|uniref:DUF6404 family protein n=1 Tax=Lysobacter sp. N42 TaxID=2545719 RepID=UPI00104315CD|nr:DUF6404 family protein [Lysobacter sp. N42]TCZ76924.1 hypothetical protein EYQ95_26135 [Lysobacter sp. N42]